MVWEVHQPKLGRYHPPAPLIYFVFLPVRPSGLQGRRASLLLMERSDHTLQVHSHSAHFSITQMRWNNKRNSGPCLATAEQWLLEAQVTLSSAACLSGHIVKHPVRVPKQWWQKPAVYHQRQPLSSSRHWRNGTPFWPTPTALLQFFTAHKTRQMIPRLTIQKLGSLTNISGRKSNYFT